MPQRWLWPAKYKGSHGCEVMEGISKLHIAECDYADLERNGASLLVYRISLLSALAKGAYALCIDADSWESQHVLEELNAYVVLLAELLQLYAVSVLA